MLSFLANLVLAFPVILLFYLLVTPGIMETAIPYTMAGIFFAFPILFLLTLFVTCFRKRPSLPAMQVALVVVIVGESGCGKSTLAKVLLGLETATSGQVMLGSTAIQNTQVQDRTAKDIASIQMVFHYPFDTLNPSHTIGNQIIHTLEQFDVGDNQNERKELML